MAEPMPGIMLTPAMAERLRLFMQAHEQPVYVHAHVPVSEMRDAINKGTYAVTVIESAFKTAWTIEQKGQMRPKPTGE